MLGTRRSWVGSHFSNENEVINHVHIQLFPRYAGDAIGSTRFVMPRSALENGDELAQRVRSILVEILDKQKQ